ncbi:hypothetical protein ACWN6Y_01295 [Vagococcus teuberi]|uniref:hypothetical protein n=1 Tax=Vagococcus teuberi TaxID=519472 RepID=UPI0012EDAAC1|nr:hypothetical protein [Vagococcus teuberi]
MKNELTHSFDVVKIGGKIASITSIHTPSYTKSAMKEISSGRVKGKIVVDFTNKKINE